MNKEIEKAASDCEDSFKDIQVGSLVQHCHHGQWIEILQEPAKNRIDFILSFKKESEQAERLRRFRPLKDADRQKVDADWQKANADWQKADADWQKASTTAAMIVLHAEICGCPWSATTDIFGNKI